MCSRISPESSRDPYRTEKYRYLVCCDISLACCVHGFCFALYCKSNFPLVDNKGLNRRAFLPNQGWHLLTKKHFQLKKLFGVDKSENWELLENNDVSLLRYHEFKACPSLNQNAFVYGAPTLFSVKNRLLLRAQ